MQVDILTLFPDMFVGPFDESIMKRAQDKKLATINTHNLRQWGIDKRGTVDGRPYGGGAGMLFRPEPLFDAVEEIALCHPDPKQSEGEGSIQIDSSHSSSTQNDKVKSKIVLLDAGGTPYNQQKAEEYSTLDQLILICGHYEGVDYRVHEHLADDVVSIGDFVLTGGELPAMMVTDSVVRLIPGVLENEESVKSESFSQNTKHKTQNKNSLEIDNWKLDIPSSKSLVEYPQYTRPEEYKGHKVPEVLLSGHHAQIEKWRKEQSIKRSEKRK